MSSPRERPATDQRRRARLIVGLSALLVVVAVLVVWLVLFAVAS